MAKYLDRNGVKHLTKKIHEKYHMEPISQDEINDLFGSFFEIRIFDVKVEDSYTAVSKINFENLDFVSANPSSFSNTANQTSTLTFTTKRGGRSIPATLSVSKMDNSGGGDNIADAFATSGSSTFDFVTVADRYPSGTSPYGTSPYGTSPYGTSPYGTSPYGTSPYEGVYCQAGNANATGFDFVIRFNKAFEKEFLNFSMSTKGNTGNNNYQQQKFRIELYSYKENNGVRNYRLVNTCTWTRDTTKDTGNFIVIDFSKGNQTLTAGTDHY
jgi:hypothetical protein